MKNGHNFVLCPRSNGVTLTPSQNSGVPTHLGIGILTPEVGGTFMSTITSFGRSVPLKCVRVVGPDRSVNPFDVPIVFYEKINE